MNKQYYLLATWITIFINIIVISTMVILQFLIGLVNEYVDFIHTSDSLDHLLHHHNIFMSYVSFVPIGIAAISLYTYYEYKNVNKNKPE